jgi:hypothetical protein
MSFNTAAEVAPLIGYQGAVFAFLWFRHGGRSKSFVGFLQGWGLASDLSGEIPDPILTDFLGRPP